MLFLLSTSTNLLKNAQKCSVSSLFSLYSSQILPMRRFERRASGPSMAAGSVMVIMTSLTSSIGMSPITRMRLASSRVSASGSLRFSPAQPRGKKPRYSTGAKKGKGKRRRIARWHQQTCDGLGAAAVHAAQGGHAAQAFGQRRRAGNCGWTDHCRREAVAQRV